jgi:hypothetical protein
MTAMRLLLIVHVLAGSVGLVSGYLALGTVKGARVHRRSGMVFVAAMLVMCLAGGVMAARAGGPWGWVNFRAATLTAYLVVTALTTVRPIETGGRSLAIGGMLVAATVGTISLTFGIEAIAGGGRREGVPAFPFFLFGIIGVLGALGDLRGLRSGALHGVQRIARHLWRMSVALLIAAMSFFFGQQKVMPPAMRIPLLLAIPVLAVLVTMLYWLWRVRFKRSFRGLRIASVVRAS